VQILVGYGRAAGPMLQTPSAGVVMPWALGPLQACVFGVCRPALLGLQNRVLDADPHAWVCSNLGLGSAEPPRGCRPV